MTTINYTTIIAKIDTDSPVEYFREQMQIAERDFFQKPERFLRMIKRELLNLFEITNNEINDEIKQHEKERDEALKGVKDPTSTASYIQIYKLDEFDKDILNESGEVVRKAIPYNEYHIKREKERAKMYQRYIDELTQKQTNQMLIFKLWLDAVSELETKGTISASRDFVGITDDLKDYIEGATDGIIENIIKKKRLPDGAQKPKWIGSKADAHRFRLWIDTTEKPMIDCFDNLTTDNFKRSGATGDSFQYEKAGTIFDILQKYPKT